MFGSKRDANREFEMSEGKAAIGAGSGVQAALRVPCEKLRWRCGEADLGFQSTEQVEPLPGIIGQDDAVDALRFGLEIYAPGQNIFVRGLTGTGRMTSLSRLLEEIQPGCALGSDFCYVHGFDRPDRPRLLTLPRGRAKAFASRIDELLGFIRNELGPALSSDALRARREFLEELVQERSQQIAQPFEEELRANQLTMANVQVGSNIQPAMLPLIDGEPAPPEKLEQLRRQGALDDAAIEQIQERIKTFSKRLQEVSQELQEIQNEHAREVRGLYQGAAREILANAARATRAEHSSEDVSRFLDALIADVVERGLDELKEGNDPTRLYRVNPILAHAPDEPCPIIVENTPTVSNLLGTIDRQILPQGGSISDHTMINAGSLLRADGGYLILDARDVLSEPGAWRILVRTLRTEKLEIVSPDSMLPWVGRSLKPEPIPLQVKVILIGDPGLYHLLDSHDVDFSNLFKVLADFDSTIERCPEGIQRYAGVLARIATEEGLPHFEAGAVAALAEHGARIAARSDRLTTRFGRLVDLAREAAFLTRKRGAPRVSADTVRDAIRLNKRRGDLPARRFREMVAEGTIRIQTTGAAVGQVNGLAVMSAGPLTYGFPSRITSTIGPGSAGAINIERESQLSGAIHTKGFYILGGLLRHLLRTHHPLAFSASVAFEQSYGGIDGDSASGAEICCLLSALTEVPLRQDLAMTGAIDQHGHIQPIGAATEKIEGFFDTCSDGGLTGTQGVIIPASNVRNLMLREDVVEACRDGRFSVYAVDTIQQALALFTGREVGELGEDDEYPEGTLLAEAVSQVYDYWAMAAIAPYAEVVEEVEEEEEGSAEA